MINQMKNNPKIRAELKSLGYVDDQLPDWVAEEQEEHEDYTTTPTPVGKPSIRTPKDKKARKMEGANQATYTTGQPTGGAGRSTGSTPATAFDVVNKVLGPSGQHVESLGSDALHVWMQENPIEGMSSGYRMRRRVYMLQIEA